MWSRVVGWRPGWSRVADVLGAGGRGEAGRAGERRTPAELTSFSALVARWNLVGGSFGVGLVWIRTGWVA